MQPILVNADQPLVLVVDSLALRRACITGLLGDWARARNLSTAAVPKEALQALLAGPRSPIALCILNLGAASVAAPECLGSLGDVLRASATTPVVILSDRQEVEEVVTALRHGARGFVPTSTEPEIALEVFSFVLAGGSFFPPTALLEVNRARRGGAGNSAPRLDGSATGRGASQGGAGPKRASLLTEKQQAVLAHLRLGETNKAIARLLGMQEATVKVHLRQIMKKLGASNRTQAALVTLQDGGAGREGGAGGAGRGAGTDTAAILLDVGKGPGGRTPS